jgi:signal transduction histidine kinase
MLDLVISSSNADRAVLLLREDEAWVGKASVGTEAEERDVLLNQGFSTADAEADLVPANVLRRCTASRALLLVPDAGLDRRLADDETIKREGVRSLLCIPVTIQGRLEAMVYLDSRHTTGAFTEQDAELLEHLALQFAVSVRQARLHAALERPGAGLGSRHDEQRLLVGGQSRLSGPLLDIDRANRAEEVAPRGAELIHGMMKQAPFAIEILTPDGALVAVNPAWDRLFGVADSAEEGRILADYNMLVDSQVADLGLAEQVKRAFAGNPEVLPVIQYDAAKEGEALGFESADLRKVWIQSYLYPVKDENGDVVFVVNTYLDLTDVKRAEREAQERREALARVERITKLGQLSGAIVHEISQPLTGILSTAQGIEVLLESDGWERAEVAEGVSQIVADCKRAARVVTSLRDVYRRRRGERAPFDVNSVVADTTALLRSEFDAQEVALTLELCESLPVVSGSQVQVGQVLLNILMNAIQSVHDSAPSDRGVRVTTGLDEAGVRVWVQDTGPGIDTTVIDRIFDPFATWKPEGSGMGLAVSNVIIEAHGGTMSAENVPDGGARVGFVLPALDRG